MRQMRLGSSNTSCCTKTFLASTILSMSEIPNDGLLQERDSIEVEVTADYRRYAAEDQRRDQRGRLIDPLAQTFEGRMNRGLEEYLDVCRLLGRLGTSSA